MDVASEHQIFQHRHVFEKLDVLKAPRDSEPGNPIGPEARDFLSLKDQFSLLRFVKTVDDVVQAGLTGAVGADNGKDFPLFYVKAHIKKDRYPAKAQGKLFTLQDNFFLNTTFSHPFLLRINHDYMQQDDAIETTGTSDFPGLSGT
jgi:hypothetical protein